jgi:hypothetical protein
MTKITKRNHLLFGFELSARNWSPQITIQIMNLSPNRIIVWATLLMTATVLVGCKCIETHKSKKHEAYYLPFPWDPCQTPPDERDKIIIRPDATTGTLNVPVTSFSSGSSDANCFPTTQGWNKYYVTFYLLGPNVSPLPSPNNYPNPNNLNSVTLDTMAPGNGATLDTGLLIVDNLNPNSKVCDDDASPTYTPNPKLSKVTFTPTGTNHKYRAGIFYKSGTATGLTNIVVHWSYP